MQKFSFEDLEVYKQTRRLIVEVYEITSMFPSTEKYSLSNQIQRAIVSVASNIAEGSGRVSHKEKVHFLEIAYASLMEVFNQILIANDLGYINDIIVDDMRYKFMNISRQLNALTKYFINLTDSKYSQNH